MQTIRQGIIWTNDYFTDAYMRHIQNHLRSKALTDNWTDLWLYSCSNSSWYAYGNVFHLLKQYIGFLTIYIALLPQ